MMMMTCLSLKNCFNAQDGWEKKLCTKEFQQKGSSTGKHEMQVASKKVYWKSIRVFQTLCAILPLKKIFYQNLTNAFFISIYFKYPPPPSWRQPWRGGACPAVKLSIHPIVEFVLYLSVAWRSEKLEYFFSIYAYVRM